MTPGIKNWTFKRGTNWTMLFRFKNRDLTGAAVKILIKRIGETAAVFDSSQNSTFVAASGTFSKTLDGSDTVVLWDISYEKTGEAVVGQPAYRYDVEITENGSRSVEIEGQITVTRNV